MSQNGENTANSHTSVGYDERKITQLRELKTIIWGLDLDEGIRFVAELPGYKEGAFVFLTKCDDQYCLSIKEKVMDDTTKRFVPGGREQWKYFETAESAWAYVSRFLKPPFEAYYY